MIFQAASNPDHQATAGYYSDHYAAVHHAHYAATPTNNMMLTDLHGPNHQGMYPPHHPNPGVPHGMHGPTALDQSYQQHTNGTTANSMVRRHFAC